MIVQIVDNRDLMLTLSADAVDLAALQSQGFISKSHPISETTWLVRCTFDNFTGLQTSLIGKTYKMVVVRFSSGSTYFSSDVQDQLIGQNITG